MIQLCSFRDLASVVLSSGAEAQMRYETMRSRGSVDEWRVEGIDYEHDGQVFVTIFSGPDAERRAREYAEWKNSAKDIAREPMPAHA